MIFVTGGTGLVGSHVLLRLSQEGRSFKALKRDSSSIKICRNVFFEYNESKLFETINWVDGDINDISSLEREIEECTFVLHCAALVSFHPSDLQLLKKVNIEGTENIINVAINSGIKKLGYISSIAALGRNSTKNIVDENCYFTPTHLESNYALSKYYAEQEVWRGSQEGLDIIIINPSLILGPGSWEKGSSKIFERVYNGLKFYTSGSTGFVDVIDVADSLLALFFSDIKNERFIINGANLKYRVVFEKIAERFGRPKPNIKVTPFLKEIAWRLEFIRSFLTGKRSLITKETANSGMKKNSYSTEKIKNEIQFKFTSIDVTIRRYCDWYIKDLQ